MILPLLTAPQLLALVQVPNLIHRIYEARCLASETGLPGEGWLFWQTALVTANQVTACLSCPWMDGRDWAAIVETCELARTLIAQLPADHNARTLMPEEILLEIRAIASEHEQRCAQ